MYYTFAGVLQSGSPLPTEPDRIDQSGIEDVNLADGEVVGYGGGHAKPRA